MFFKFPVAKCTLSSTSYAEVGSQRHCIWVVLSLVCWCIWNWCIWPDIFFLLQNFWFCWHSCCQWHWPYFTNGTCPRGCSCGISRSCSPSFYSCSCWTWCRPSRSHCYRANCWYNRCSKRMLIIEGYVWSKNWGCWAYFFKETKLPFHVPIADNFAWLTFCRRNPISIWI